MVRVGRGRGGRAHGRGQHDGRRVLWRVGRHSHFAFLIYQGPACACVCLLGLCMCVCVFPPTRRPPGGVGPGGGGGGRTWGRLLPRLGGRSAPGGPSHTHTHTRVPTYTHAHTSAHIHTCASVNEHTRCAGGVVCGLSDARFPAGLHARRVLVGQTTVTPHPHPHTQCLLRLSSIPHPRYSSLSRFTS
jgi:hypothetical protein